MPSKTRGLGVFAPRICASASPIAYTVVESSGDCPATARMPSVPKSFFITCWSPLRLRRLCECVLSLLQSFPAQDAPVSSAPQLHLRKNEAMCRLQLPLADKPEHSHATKPRAATTRSAARTSSQDAYADS